MCSINPQNAVLAFHSRSYIITFLIADSLLFSGNLTLAVQSPMVKKFLGKNGFRCKLNHNKVNKQINKKLSRSLILNGFLKVVFFKMNLISKNCEKTKKVVNNFSNLYSIHRPIMLRKWADNLLWWGFCLTVARQHWTLFGSNHKLSGHSWFKLQWNPSLRAGIFLYVWAQQ